MKMIFLARRAMKARQGGIDESRVASVMQRPDSMHHCPHIADLRVIRGAKSKVPSQIGHRFPVAPKKKVDHGAVMNFLAGRRVNGHRHFNYGKDFGKILTPEESSFKV